MKIQCCSMAYPLKNKETKNGIIEAPLKADRIREIYNFASNFYALANPFEKKARMRGIELADIKPSDKVLEVAIGLGYSFLEILKRIDKENAAFGIDLSPSMLAKAKKLLVQNGYSNFNLQEGDARRLPFPDETFDVIYNSYMLDLIPLADIPTVLKEFHRTLKKGGRLVLVNFSKKDASPVFMESLYKISPDLWFGCRPVLMESFVKQSGFKNVAREFLKVPLPSEIVTGQK